eukprot:2682080-Heterocapsa_arctica.AAC.1
MFPPFAKRHQGLVKGCTSRREVRSWRPYAGRRAGTWTWRSCSHPRPQAPMRDVPLERKLALG